MDLPRDIGQAGHEKINEIDSMKSLASAPHGFSQGDRPVSVGESSGATFMSEPP